MMQRAQALRREMTDAERKLWRALRREQIAGLNFRRQRPIGDFVLDFYCPRIRLAIELDGGQHALASKVHADERRTRWLEDNHDIKVVRFWNNDVMRNFTGVLSEMVRIAEDKLQRGVPPSPPLPLSGGGSGAAP
jgi:very-short-patch-repair endonuclease